MEYVDHFMDLEVYKLARQLSIRVFEITKTFPKSETYALTDQMRRSSQSIGGQIAEAWAKRDYERHFISKLTDADGEQLETQHWWRTSMDCSYITDEVGNQLLGDYQLLGKMIYTMILKAPSFCHRRKRTKVGRTKTQKARTKSDLSGSENPSLPCTDYRQTDYRLPITAHRLRQRIHAAAVLPLQPC